MLILALPATAWPVVVELNSGERVGGILVREDEAKVVIRPGSTGGASAKEERTIDRSSIRTIHRAIQRERLEALRSEEPTAYRNYAEELAERRDDPEARALARRLFLIAASLDPARLGRGCLLSMGDLADSPDDAKRFRALAFLLDPRHDRGILNVDPDRSKKAPDDPARRSFTRALRLYRYGMTNEASELARKKGVEPLFAATPGLLSYEEFLASCAAHPECTRCRDDGMMRCPRCNGKGSIAATRGRAATCPDCRGKSLVVCTVCGGKKQTLTLTDDQRKPLLRAELSGEAEPIDPAPGPGKGQNGPDRSWSATLNRDQIRPVPVLSLGTLTDINPRLCLYRAGRWIEP